MNKSNPVVSDIKAPTSSLKPYTVLIYDTKYLENKFKESTMDRIQFECVNMHFLQLHVGTFITKDRRVELR